MTDKTIEQRARELAERLWRLRMAIFQQPTAVGSDRLSLSRNDACAILDEAIARALQQQGGSELVRGLVVTDEIVDAGGFAVAAVRAEQTCGCKYSYWRKRKDDCRAIARAVLEAALAAMGAQDESSWVGTITAEAGGAIDWRGGVHALYRDFPAGTRLYANAPQQPETRPHIHVGTIGHANYGKRALTTALTMIGAPQQAGNELHWKRKFGAFLEAAKANLGEGSFGEVMALYADTMSDSGCGACGDGCANRNQCRVAEESPSSAPQQPEKE